jgi:hypothetical protein
MSRGKLIQVWPTLGYTFLPRLEFCYDEKWRYIKNNKQF